MSPSLIQQTLSTFDLDGTTSGVYSDHWREHPGGELLESINPATGRPIAAIRTAGAEDYERVVAACRRTFAQWSIMPAPARGELIRRLGDVLRRHKDGLGRLVTLEVGKIASEGVGEVQEMIDMCDFATGLSRQLYGLTIASERPAHRMFEQWHPLGPVGIITAFNFPVAVWAWNAAVAGVCGDSCLWKPSPLAPLTAIAVQRICEPVLRAFDVPGLFGLCIGSGVEPGQTMSDDRRLPLISATGSCEMGRQVGQRVAARLGRSLLELGGNNAAIITQTANLDLALRGIVFAAVGTAGQRCTTLRRLFVHESIADRLLEKLEQAYASIRIGDPWDDSVLMGPLISEAAVNAMTAAVRDAREQGGEVLSGGEPLERNGYYVQPTLIQATYDLPIIQQETFAPILYVIPYRDLDEALGWHNSVDQGLSSAIFTDRVSEAERFLSPTGSDCGIANVNIGTSGAEIGGAFGGEKDTGGGREAGSDAWKAYMRRQTCTVNYGRDLPLAQGVEFDL